jgi:hypothetical protein
MITPKALLLLTPDHTTCILHTIQDKMHFKKLKWHFSFQKTQESTESDFPKNTFFHIKEKINSTHVIRNSTEASKMLE